MDLEDKKNNISRLFRKILLELGASVDDDPDFTDTPDRYADSLLEMLKGSFDLDKQIAEIMAAKFPADGYDEMVRQQNIYAIGICPHHFLPIFYNITIGYIPSPTGTCLGLSKLARLAEILAARAVKQEKLTVDIVQYLVTHLKPIGAGAIVEGIHGCMVCRGVKQKDSVTVTTKLYGAMMESISTRSEFLNKDK